MNALPAALPSNRDENWKYANLRALGRASFEPSVAPDDTRLAQVAAKLPARLPNVPRLVLVDGHAVPSLCDTLSSVRFDESPCNPSAAGVDHFFANLNAQRRRTTCRVHLRAHEIGAIEIICVASGVSHPAIALRLDEGARLSLIERHLPLDGNATTLSNLHLEADIGAHAELMAARIGLHGAKAQYLETVELRLAAAATVQWVQLATGAAASRSTAFVEHAGRDAMLEWHSATIGDGTQCHDAYVRVNHAAPGSRTLQQFRGLASGRAKIAFNGHMRVDAAAPGSQSDQSLKSLLSGTEAEANARPQLEIYTDAVKASHGATVGKLDPDMLFYLLSRGIPPAAAESLLKWAFVSDVLMHISSPELRAQVETALEQQLPGAAAARLADPASMPS